MCGIYGQIGNPASTWAEVEPFLHHRGPDAHGFWQEGSVLLGHTRLSILDLSSEGNQPFTRDPDYVLVFNGEIFNYIELGKTLKSRNEIRGHSDTEILYYHLIENGIEKLDQLNGMFSFAFLDRKKKKLHLVRDRFGVKPLYFYSNPGEPFYFASEQKAIYPRISKTLNTDRLGEQFAFKFIFGRETLVQNLNELNPGERLEFDLESEKWKSTFWYRPPDRKDIETPNLEEELFSLLHDAVHIRLRSDVPFGVQLSGGVDSSIITQMVTQELGKPLNSYSVIFPGSSDDEQIYAREIAARCGTKHIEIPFGLNEFSNAWEEAVYHHDEPINHPHGLPIYLLTQKAKEEVSVLLSGEGADEAFCGYEQHRNVWHLNPDDSNEVWVNQYAFLKEDRLQKMLGTQKGSFKKACASRVQFLEESSERKDRYKHFELRAHLLSLLNRIDKMSMAHAVEIRTPFLDYRVMALGLKEKRDHLVGENFRKKPLMAIYEKMFRNNLSTRKKVAFRVPYDQWLMESHSFRDSVVEKIITLRSDEIFEKGYIESLIQTILSEKWDEKPFQESWVLSNFAIWKNRFKIQF